MEIRGKNESKNLMKINRYFIINICLFKQTNMKLNWKEMEITNNIKLEKINCRLNLNKQKKKKPTYPFLENTFLSPSFISE